MKHNRRPKNTLNDKAQRARPKNKTQTVFFVLCFHHWLVFVLSLICFLVLTNQMAKIEHAQTITNKDETNTYKHNNNYNTPNQTRINKNKTQSIPKNIKHMRT